MGTEVRHKIAPDSSPNAVHEYSAVDLDTELSGYYYYRVKQVDFDGKFTYSDIVYVSYINESDIILYPSPAVNETNLDINLEMASKIKIQLFDATAKLIYTVADKVFDEGGHTITIHLNDLASGVYNLVLNINGEQMNKKVIKID